MIRLGELTAADESLQLVGDPLTPIEGLAYDVRSVRRGDLFAALDGDEFRGHGFAADAASRGARAVLAERLLPLDVPLLLAADARAAFANVAAAFHGYPSLELEVIGVTGTDGKTTTAKLLEAILRAAGLVTGSITTVGSSIGDRASGPATRLTTPESPDVQAQLRAMVDAGVEWAVLEATSHGLALSRLGAVRFAVAAVTNITHEHLDFHGSPAGYRRAKALLFEAAREAGGVAVVNVDDPGAREMLASAGSATAIRYGFGDEAEADVRAVDVRLDANGARFVLVTPDGRAPVELPLLGRFNVANALCAAACAFAAGVPLEAIAAGLRSAPPVPGRLTPISAGQPFAVVVDYAHTPTALEPVLELLRSLHPGSRLIAVVGSAGERDLLKRPWLGEVAARGADYSVFTSEDPRLEDPDAIVAQLAAGAVSAGGRAGETFACITDRRDAIRHALATAQPRDCVLLAGKGHERSIVWGTEELPWDEAGVARAALLELGYAENGR